MAPGRASYTFGFTGPAVAVDTACSSALVGAHMARLSMLAATCRTALASGAAIESGFRFPLRSTADGLSCLAVTIACHQWFALTTCQCTTLGTASQTVLLSLRCASCAGVKLILTPITSALFAAAGMLSSDGRCKTLSAAADGFSRGEACVTLTLQLHGSAAEAEATQQGLGAGGEGPGLLLLLKGTAVGQDGRSSSLTAPNGPAQQATMAAALVEATLRGQARMMLACHSCAHEWQNTLQQTYLVCCRTGLRVGMFALHFDLNSELRNISTGS